MLISVEPGLRTLFHLWFWQSFSLFSWSKDWAISISRFYWLSQRPSFCFIDCNFSFVDSLSDLTFISSFPSFLFSFFLFHCLKVYNILQRSSETNGHVCLCQVIHLIFRVLTSMSTVILSNAFTVTRGFSVLCLCSRSFQTIVIASLFIFFDSLVSDNVLLGLHIFFHFFSQYSFVYFIVIKVIFYIACHLLNVLNPDCWPGLRPLS